MEISEQQVEYFRLLWTVIVAICFTFFKAIACVCDVF